MNTESNLTPRKNALWPGATGTPLTGWVFEHEYYEAVREWIWDCIECNDEPVIVVVLGATAAGKTTLRQQFQREIVTRRAAELAANPGVIPYVCGETVYHPRVGVDWAGLFSNWLTCAGEILIDKKSTHDRENGGRLSGLQTAVTKMLLHRSPSIALVDEAHVLLGKRNVSSTDVLETNINYMKGLCNMSQTHLGLFGDYQLGKMAQITSQLDRRCYFGHLPPYSDANADFLKTLDAFELRFSQFGVESELRVNADLLFNGCLGCVGLLRRWLTKAYTNIRHKHAPITKKVLLETHSPAAEIMKYRAEITDGAARMAWMKDIEPGSVYEPQG